MELASSFDGTENPSTSEPARDVQATLSDEPEQPFFSLISSSLLAVHEEEAAAATELHAEPRLAVEHAFSPAVSVSSRRISRARIEPQQNYPPCLRE